MNILVTGGAGFIGSHIVEHFQGKASEIRVLDSLRTGKKSNLRGMECTYIEGSSAGVKKIVFASSAAVYGDNPSSPKVETMCPAPKSPYAITKLDGEQYLNLFHNEGKILTTSLRFFNVFGPRQDPQGAYAAAVPIFMEKALRGENIIIHGDGNQTRDFIYVKDIVGALAYAAMNDSMQGSYNAGYSEETTILDLARSIAEMAGTKCTIEHGEERPGDIKHSLASANKLLQAGWQPEFTLQQGLAETLAYTKASLGLPQ